MRKLVFMLSLLFSAEAIVVRAQDVPMAVLQKGDDTQCFYGSTSFQEACKAADHGDVITLSSGIFLAPTITKAVSIFGSGADLVTDTIEKPLTRTNGDIHIAVDSLDGKPAQGLYVEGILSDDEVWVEQRLEVASFAKCRFNHFNFYTSTDKTAVSSEMCSFYQCRFAGWFEPGDASGMSVYNSVVNYMNKNTESSTLTICNCVLINTSAKLKNTMFKNSYLFAVGNDGSYHSMGDIKTMPTHPISNARYSTCKLDASCSAFKCLDSTKGDYSKYDLVVIKELYYPSSSSLSNSEDTYSPFKTSIKYYSDMDSYELSDGAKTKYLGTDGNPICLYGGDYPYTMTPSIPYIVEKNIATKSENGKLKVSVKVAVPGASL